MPNVVGPQTLTPQRALAQVRAGWAGFFATQKKAKGGAIDAKKLPPDLTAAIAKIGPSVLHKYVRAVDGKIEEVVDDGLSLPSDDQLVIISQTISTVSATGTHVEVHTVIAKKSK